MATRHNLGEEVALAIGGDVSFGRAPQRMRAEVATLDRSGRRVILALPTTFMNDSGAAVSPLMRYFKVDNDHTVLVHDDIDLPFGKLRFHFGRGSGGHNGVGSVIAGLHGEGVWRLKLGVGRPPGRMAPADFVLRRFYDRERDDVDLMVASGADVLDAFFATGGDAARQAAGDATARLGIATR